MASKITETNRKETDARKFWAAREEKEENSVARAASLRIHRPRQTHLTRSLRATG